jgi:hypothetical protein
MMRQGLRPVAIVMMIGWGGMFWLSRLMRNLLFGKEAVEFFVSKGRE